MLDAVVPELVRVVQPLAVVEKMLVRRYNCTAPALALEAPS